MADPPGGTDNSYATEIPGRAVSALEAEQAKQPSSDFNKPLADLMASDRMKILGLATKALEAAQAKQPSSDFDKPLTDIDFTTQKRKSDQAFRRQVVLFRTVLFYYLLVLMTIETLALSAIIVLASLPSKVLVIGDTTLQVLAGATIAQVSAMLIVIIKSVFSDSLNKIIMSGEAQPPIT